MSLTRKQKQILKKEVKNKSLNQVVENLGVSFKEAESYLLKIWGREKYERITGGQKYPQGKSFLPITEILPGGKLSWQILTFLAFLILVVYFNALNNDFLSDDIAAIKENPLIGKVRIFWRPPYFDLPLRSFLNFLIYHLFDLKPLFYRLPNVFFHLGSTFLIYFLLNFFFKPPLPFFTAGIFAVHPILTEAVTWISGGPYSNSAFFVLLALFTYIFAKKTNKKIFYFWSIISFFIALLFSEKTLAFAAIFPFYELCFGSFKKNWLKILPYLILGAFWVFYLFGLIGTRITELQTAYYQEPGLNNPLTQIPIAISSYLELIFWPKNLAFYHSELNFTPFQFSLKAIITLIYFAVLIYFLKKDRSLFFWLAFFLIALSPTLTPLRIAWVVAERYVYLASLGIFIFMVFLISKTEKLFKNQKAPLIIFIILILGFSIRTIIRNFDWKNQDTLWLATAKTSPSSPQNHNNLGDLYARRGEFEKAIEEFQTAIALKPNYADAYHNLANIYWQVGKIDLAEENYQKALNFNPYLWQSAQNLAALYFNQKKFALAIENMEKAIAINPQNPNLYLNLGIIYLQIGEKQKAEELFKKTLILNPQSQEAKQLLLAL